MRLHDRHVVITGGGSGIGRALAIRAHAEGARAVVVADVDEERVDRVAADLNRLRPGSALGAVVDVSTEVANVTLIDRASRAFGVIDLFFANAGVAVGTDLDITTEAQWAAAFDVNVHAHRWAAKHLLPAWLERGEGYFIATASAAGLLAQIGRAPYSVTKHAAVAFAEWMSITYGDRGVRVSCLCPQGVNTDMLSSMAGQTAGGAATRAGGSILEVGDVTDVVVHGIAQEQFLLLPHPEVYDYLQRKASDADRWLSGMRRLQARAAPAG